MSLHTFFGPNASRKRPLDESSSSSSSEAAPLPDPRTFVAWNADSLLPRVKKNASELGAFLTTTKPDVVFVSEVRMPARGPPGAKPKDGKPRERGALSRADKKASEEAEAIGSLLARHQYRAYYSLADQKYAGSALLVRRGVEHIAQPRQARHAQRRARQPQHAAPVRLRQREAQEGGDEEAEHGGVAVPRSQGRRRRRSEIAARRWRRPPETPARQN